MDPPLVKRRRVDRWRWLAADLLAARGCQMLLLVILAAYGALYLVPVENLEGLFLTLGLSRDGLLHGRVWEVISYAFLHGNLVHLLINAIGILLIGCRVERIGGAAVVWKVFLAGAIAGGLAQVLLAPPSHQQFPLVGASGGFSALLLWMTTLSPESRMMPLPISAKNLGRGILLAEAGFLIASWVMPETGLYVVAHACHLGGGVVGWAMGRRLLKPAISLEDLKKERARREATEPPGGRS